MQIHTVLIKQTDVFIKYILQERRGASFCSKTGGRGDRNAYHRQESQLHGEQAVITIRHNTLSDRVHIT